MKNLKTLAYLTLLLPLLAHAGREGNGGDPLALEFAQSARDAIQDIQNSAGEYPAIKAAELSATLSTAKILIVNEALFVTSGKTKQESAAVNFSETNSIYVNRKSWSSITSSEIRKALALHELLGLAGKESTGSYPISQKYLLRQGVGCRIDQCLKAPVTLGIKYAQMASLFQEARIPTVAELNKTYGQVGIAYEPSFERDASGYESWYDASGKEGYLDLKATTDFAGASVITASLYVKPDDEFLNKVVTQNQEAGAACFSTPAGYYENRDPFYGEAGKRYNDSYFAYSCRMLGNNSQKMLCAKTLKVHPSEAGTMWEKKWDRMTIAYVAFVLAK